MLSEPASEIFMELQREEKRKAERYPVRARVSVTRKDGETVSAESVNVSSSGLLLRVEEPFRFRPGEEVTIELELASDEDKPLTSWGLAKVVRVDERLSAIQLSAGTFHRRG